MDKNPPIESKNKPDYTNFLSKLDKKALSDKRIDTVKNIFDGKKPDTSGLSPEQAKNAINEYNDMFNYVAYEKRQSIFDEYTRKTGNHIIQHPYNVSDADVAYNYVNKNATGNSPVAQDYCLTTQFNYTPLTGSTGQSYAVGQRDTNGNDVPIGNTFVAYLSNNNAKTTALIGNTTPEKLADNFFQTADNIQKGEALGIVKDGNKLLATKTDGSGTQFIDGINMSLKITPNNGVLDKNELGIAKEAYVNEAKALTAASKLKGVDGDAVERLSSASTVDIDADDPYNKFFEKVASLDGHAGVTKEELTKGIAAISEQTKDGGLLFTKEKLDKFLNDK